MRPFMLAASLVFVLASVRAEEARPLLPGGDFEGRESWGRPKGATYEAEGHNHFLRLHVLKPGETVLVHRAVAIPDGVEALRLRFKVRFEKIERGKQAWFDGRIMMNFKDASGRKLEPSPQHPSFVGTSKYWNERTQVFRVAKGAKTLELMFTLFQAKAGRLDFDDVTLDAVSASDLHTPAPPTPAARIPAPTTDKLPPALHVDGKRLVDANGREAWLQGVAIPSLEWSAGGEHILESIAVATRDWKANCIRLPVRETFWAGKDVRQAGGPEAYRQVIDDAVNSCAGAGAYIVIDLHDYRAPEAKHAAFWREVAAKYKNHPAVLFDLFNEPHDVSWDVWRNGGTVTDRKKEGEAVAAENADKLVSFQSIGMQGLLDAVRETGARNVVIAGGLDWGYDLSGVLETYALTDPSGDGVMYSSHVYPWKRDWKRKFLDAAEKHPIFLGEVGADVKKMEFIPASAQEDPATWAPDMLAAIQEHHLHWTAWAFHPGATPRVILDWKYTPTPFWGALVQRALAGERFPTGKLR